MRLAFLLAVVCVSPLAAQQADTTHARTMRHYGVNSMLIAALADSSERFVSHATLGDTAVVAVVNVRDLRLRAPGRGVLGKLVRIEWRDTAWTRVSAMPVVVPPTMLRPDSSGSRP